MISERVYITDVYVDLPSDITVIPQNYTVHCIVTGSLDGATIKQYAANTEVKLTQSHCNNQQHDGYSCSMDNTLITTSYTYPTTRDYTVTVEWKGENVSSGAFRQSVHDGDHMHHCTAASGVIYPEHKGRTRNLIVQGEKRFT